MSLGKHSMISAIFAASLFSFIMLFASTAAHAQPGALWPPQCTPITVINNSPCISDLCLKTNAGSPLCVFGLPGDVGQGTIDVPFGTLFGGVVSIGNISYPFVATGAGTYVASNVMTGPSDCCSNITYDPKACTMVITLSKMNPCNP